MLNNLRKKNKKLIQKYLKEEKAKEHSIQLIIKEMLKFDDCFNRLAIEDAYALLENLEIKPEKVRDVYVALTKKN